MTTRLNSVRSELIQKQSFFARLGSNQEQQERISRALQQIDQYLKKVPQLDKQ